MILALFFFILLIVFQIEEGGVLQLWVCISLLATMAFSLENVKALLTKTNSIDVFVFLYSISLIVSDITLASDSRASSITTAQLSGCLAYGLIRLVLLSTTTVSLSFTLILVIVSSVIQSSICIYQIIVGTPETWRWSDARIPFVESPLRAVGMLVVQSPNTVAGFIVLGIPASLFLSSWYFEKQKTLLSALFFNTTIIMLLGIMSTGSRNAGLCAVLLLIVSSFYLKKGRVFFTIAPFIFSCFIFNEIASLSAVYTRYFNLANDPATYNRISIVDESLRDLYKIPLLGVGANSVSYEKFINSSISEISSIRGTHNYFLEILIRFGWLTLVFILAISALLLTKLKENQALLQPFVMASLSLLFLGIFDTHLLISNFTILFFSLVAVVASFDKNRTEKNILT